MYKTVHLTIGCTDKHCARCQNLRARLNQSPRESPRFSWGRMSSQNMILIAQSGPKGLVVADNDKSGAGERAARDIGYPYFLPPNGDFNDFWLENGTFRSSQALKKVLTICK